MTSTAALSSTVTLAVAPFSEAVYLAAPNDTVLSAVVADATFEADPAPEAFMARMR